MTPHVRRAITPARVFAVILLLLYGWMQYLAAGMGESRLPPSLAHKMEHTGGILVAYQAGDDSGRPVVFVHGTPGQADNWAYFLQNPRPGIQCIAVDRPGFGASTPIFGYRRLQDEAAALLPLLASLRGRDPILVGHSLGGPVIAQAALDYPDLVGGLVMVAASLDPSVEKIFAAQFLGDLPGLRLVLPRVLRNSNRELIPLREDLEHLFPRLKDIRCPITLLHGTDDSLVPFSNVAYMEKAFSPGTVRKTIVLEGENHFVPWTAKEDVWRAVEAIAE